MKFVVLRGTAGFGDRLQCLLVAIQYAKATGRYLVVDWRDKDWSHDASISADYYFDFTNLNHINVNCFLEFYKNYNQELTIIQEIWKENIYDKDSDIYKNHYQLSKANDVIGHITEGKMDDFKEDIVVYPGVGFRKFHYVNFRHVSLKYWLQEKLKSYKLSEHFTLGHYDVVHLRAGSKVWGGRDNDGHPDLLKQIDSKYPTLDSYLDYMWEQYLNALDSTLCSREKQASDNLLSDMMFVANTSQLVILSDAQWLADEWIKRFECGQYIDLSYKGSMTASGIHKASDEILKQQGVNKIEMNIEVIRDFAVMCNARHVISDGLSVFSKMGDKCKSYANKTWTI